MPTRSPSLLAFLSLSPLAIAACGSDAPPTPTEARSQITSDLGNVLRESNTAYTNGRDALPASETLSLFDRVLGTHTAGSLGASAMAPVIARFTGGVAADGAPVIDADAEVSYLNDKLFTDANHVGDGVYQVPAALACARTTVDASGASTSTVDQKCAGKLAQVDLRIRTAKDGGTLTFAIQLDADHDEPLRLALTHTSIALTVDFDELQHASTALAALIGSDMPNMALAGQLTGKLEILGTAKARASLSIDRALSIAFAQAGAPLDGDGALVLASAKADVFSVTLDGTAKSGTFATALGETSIKLPANDGKRTALDLGGLSATATFAAGQPVQLTHVGLGDRSTTLTINGQRAETIDVNPADGRAFDATVTRDDAAGTTRIAVAPKLDLQLAVDHAVLGGSAPIFDVTRVQLSGSLTGRDAGDQVAVDGAFAITTNPASYGVIASAGQCITGSDVTDPGSGELLTRWAVAACQ